MAVGFTNDVVGRTRAVSGTLTVSDDQVSNATFKIDLTEVTVNGKTEPQFQRSLGTAEHPDAVFTLTRPMALGPGFASGGTATVSATGDLSMNGATRLVTCTVTSRRSGNEVEVSGSVPIQFSEWAIQRPAGAGFLGSLANNGVAEFLLYLQHS
jgi:polyisoprenoid-binding protein YceI